MNRYFIGTPPWLRIIVGLAIVVKLLGCAPDPCRECAEDYADCTDDAAADAMLCRVDYCVCLECHGCPSCEARDE